MMYTPDRWKVVRITYKGETFEKVFGTWVGGYVNGDSWRMNSGIDRVEKEGEYFLFYGASGSVYKCHKNGEGSTMYTESVLQNMISNAKANGVDISVVEDYAKL